MTNLILLAFTIAGFTQQPILYSGDLAFLKGQKKINVKYDYDNMNILINKQNIKEEDYINETKAEKNMKKRKPDSGDKWAKQWVTNREIYYQPQFKSMFNNTKTKKGVVVGNYPDATYTIILKTVCTMPHQAKVGFDVIWLILPIPVIYGYRVSAIDVEIWIVETNDNQKVKAKMKMKNISSGKRGGKQVKRLQTTYGYCGKYFAKYFNKNKVFKAKREKS